MKKSTKWLIKLEKNTSLKEVLDTRFLTEYFYSTQNEVIQKTIKKLKALTFKNESILPTIVIAEIIQITCAIRGKDLAQSRYQGLIQSVLDIQ